MSTNQRQKVDLITNNFYFLSLSNGVPINCHDFPLQ